VAEASSLGLAIRRRREARGLTQLQLADRLRLHKQSINRIELGRVAISMTRLSELAEALDTTALELLSDARTLEDLGEARVDTEAMVVRELGSSYMPGLHTSLPTKAYDRVRSYVQRLIRAGLEGAELAEAEQFLLNGAYNKINAREPGEKSEEDFILDIDAAWEFVRDVAGRKGLNL
jgi:transcriptional regulator with XRE-family HTH domain